MRKEMRKYKQVAFQHCSCRVPIHWKQKIRLSLEQTHSLNRLIKHSSEEARIKNRYKKIRDNLIKNKTNKLENERIVNLKTKEKH